MLHGLLFLAVGCAVGCAHVVEPPVPTRCWLERIVMFNPHTHTASLDSVRICMQTLSSRPIELPAANAAEPVF